MSNIPLARKKISRVIEELMKKGEDDLAEELCEAMQLLFRRSPVRRMPNKSSVVTVDMRKKIVDLAKTTDLHAAEIAAVLKVNPGRVSEVLQKHAGVN
ncbi:hypothetical protein [Stappia sp. ES.058]|uniref:hypothetical protein n=1 Tax=Stappia sp. ES.058 TaxID=1881061 RepID=UPI00087BC967|nr:hypothetical protein [Stappia sp. ES.058]SDU00798.1 hypothetical protein SAMN05428979_1072 [Stappia sp. ES.058]